jgi:hypothetical protein
MAIVARRSSAPRGAFLQVSRAPEKERGQGQLSAAPFRALVVGEPAMESVVIHADFGGYRLLSVAGLLEISLQRAQQLVRANYTFFWQLITSAFGWPPQKYTSLATTLKRRLTF